MKSLVCAVIAALAVATTAEAKKKPFSIAGCTAAKLQEVAATPKGQECARRQDEAFLKGGDPIFFVCSADGSVACCSGGERPQCTDISRTGPFSKAIVGGGTAGISK